MMKTAYKILAIFAAVLLSGCVTESWNDILESGPEKDQIRVGCEVEDAEANTRATAVNAFERRLEDVHVLFFTNDATENFVASAHAEFKEGSEFFSFRKPDALKPDVGYKTLVIGNAHQSVPKGYTDFDDFLQKKISYTTANNTLQAMQNKLMFLKTTGCYTPVTSSALPMTGDVLDADGNPTEFKFVAGSDEGSYVCPVRVKFRRAVCRIDMENKAADKFRVQRVMLCQGRTAGYWHAECYERTALPYIDAPYITAWNTPSVGWEENIETQKDADGNVTGQTMKAHIYALPNKVTRIAQNDASSTCLLIEGYYLDGTENTATQLTRKSYYRINLGTVGYPQSLMPNMLYNVILQNATGHGETTPARAMTARSVNILTNFASYQTSGEVVRAEDEEGAFLSVSPGRMLFHSRAGDSREVRVRCSEGREWHYEWVAEETAAAEGEATDPTGAVKNGSQWFDVAKINIGLRLTTKSANTTNSPSAQLPVRTGRMRFWTTGGQTELSCYINMSQDKQVLDQPAMTIDGKTADIRVTLNSEGGLAKLPIDCNNADAVWVATCPTKVGEHSALDYFGIRMERLGRSGQPLEVSVPANRTGKERSWTVDVQRTIGGYVSADLGDGANTRQITFVQPASATPLSGRYVGTLPESGVTIEGFVPDRQDNDNGLAVSQNIGSVNLQLNDTAMYGKRVGLIFDQNPGLGRDSHEWNSDMDAFLSTAAQTLTAHQAGSGTVRKDFYTVDAPLTLYLNVFRTGPGDPDITGRIVVEAVPKLGPTAEYPARRLKEVPFRIVTSCDIGPAYYLYANTSYGYVKVHGDRTVNTKITNADGTYDEIYVVPGEPLTTMAGAYPAFYQLPPTSNMYDALPDPDEARFTTIPDENKLMSPFFYIKRINVPNEWAQQVYLPSINRQYYGICCFTSNVTKFIRSKNRLFFNCTYSYSGNVAASNPVLMKYEGRYSSFYMGTEDANMMPDYASYIHLGKGYKGVAMPKTQASKDVCYSAFWGAFDTTKFNQLMEEFKTVTTKERSWINGGEGYYFLPRDAKMSGDADARPLRRRRVVSNASVEPRHDSWAEYDAYHAAKAASRKRTVRTRK